MSKTDNVIVNLKKSFNKYIFFSFILTCMLSNMGNICAYSQTNKEKEEIEFMYPDSSKIKKVEYGNSRKFIALDEKGKILFEIFPYDNGPDYESEGLFRITEVGKIGYADKMGNVIIKPKFDAALPFSSGMAAFCKGCIEREDGEHKIWEGGKWGFINRTGEVVIPPIFDKIYVQFNNGKAEVEYCGSSILINEKGEQATIQEEKHTDWIDLLFSSMKLAVNLYFGNTAKAEISKQQNENYIFSDRENSGYFRIQISNSQNNVLLEYDIIPQQDFSIVKELDSNGGLSNFKELITVTDYAVVYALVNPNNYTKQYKETIGIFHKIFEMILEKEKFNQPQDEELSLPQNVRAISSVVYSNYVDLQIAVPGTILPDDSAWRKICRGKMLLLQLIPDTGHTKKRWIKTIDLREDPYYTSVSEELLKCFKDALNDAHKHSASRDEIFNRTKTKIRGLFSAANSYVNFLYDKYENRLEGWLINKNALPRYPIEESVFSDYRPKDTPDTIINYMPSLHGEIEKLPEADLDNYLVLVDLLKYYTEKSNTNRGQWEDGNMVLGANPREYRPSKDELLAAEVGDRLAAIIDDNPKEKIIEFFKKENLNEPDIEYVHFTFTHADVIGSGRFFYVQTLEKVKLSRGLER